MKGYTGIFCLNLYFAAISELASTGAAVTGARVKTRETPNAMPSTKILKQAGFVPDVICIQKRYNFIHQCLNAGELRGISTWYFAQHRAAAPARERFYSMTPGF